VVSLRYPRHDVGRLAAYDVEAMPAASTRSQPVPPRPSSNLAIGHHGSSRASEIPIC
jgi:hypothetical protein